MLTPSKKRFASSVAILIILLCSAANAQQISPEEVQETKTGGISGQVVSEGGQPLANAVVSVRSFGEGGPPRTTTSDGEGKFQLTGLDRAAYLIFASAPAYVAAPRDPDSTQPSYYRIGDSVRLDLIKGGVITGKVTTATGEPVVAVRVRAYMIRDSNNRPLRYGMPFRELTTDDRGIYRIYGLAPGTYIAAAGGSGGFQVYGGGPYEADAPTFAPSSTRDTATEISIHSGEEVGNVDIRYKGEAGHNISGMVSRATTGPDTGGNVQLTSIFNGTSQWSLLTYQRPGSQGFAFYGIADGDYDLVAQSYVQGEGFISEPQRIKVKGENVTGLQLITQPLASVSGHMALEESKVPECQGKRRPVFAETVITPWHNEKNTPKDQPQFMWGLGGPTLPDKQGDFKLRNLAAGQYRFNARVLAKYWYLKSILLPSISPPGKTIPANPSLDGARNWLTVKSGERINGLALTLSAGAASFHGQIKIPEGQKVLPRTFVYLVPAEKDRSEDVLRYFASQAMPDGTFALNNLPPGRYWVLAKPVPATEVNILSSLRLPDDSEARAKLRKEAEALKIEAELKPCQNVTDFQLQAGSPAKASAAEPKPSR